VAVGLSWTAPSDDGGRSVQGFTVMFSRAGMNAWRPYSKFIEASALDNASTVTEAAIDALDPATTYDFRIAAYSAGGSGEDARITGIRTLDPIPCPLNCSAAGQCHPWNGQCDCGTGYVGAGCEFLAGAFLVADVRQSVQELRTSSFEAAFSYIMRVPASLTLVLETDAIVSPTGPPGAAAQTTLDFLLLHPQYDRATNTIPASVIESATSSARRELDAVGSLVMRNGQTYTPSTAVSLLATILAASPGEFAGIGILELYLPDVSRLLPGASLMLGSDPAGALVAPVVVEPVQCRVRLGCEACTTDPACGWCAASQTCEQGTGQGVYASQTGSAAGISPLCGAAIGSSGTVTPASALWYFHVSGALASQRSCPADCATLSACSGCAQRPDCVWCETLGQCSSRLNAGISLDLGADASDREVTGGPATGVAGSVAPSLTGTGSCGRAVAVPEACPARRCESNSGISHCGMDAACGWCELPPRAQPRCTAGTAFGPLAPREQCVSGSYYYANRTASGRNTCNDCLTLSGAGWCETSQQCATAGLTSGLATAGHCDRWVVPAEALLVGIPPSIIVSSQSQRRLEPSPESQPGVAGQSTAGRALATLQQGTYYGSASAIMLQCPAVVYPGDAECRVFSSCTACIDQVERLGCAWCENPNGQAFCTSLVAGQNICPRALLASAPSDVAAPRLGSLEHAYLSQQRCPATCPASSVITSREGRISFGSLGASSGAELVYRPSEVGTCSWFLNPAPTTLGSDGRPLDDMLVTLQMERFSLGDGDGIIVLDGLGPISMLNVIAVFLNASSPSVQAAFASSKGDAASGPATSVLASLTTRSLFSKPWDVPSLRSRQVRSLSDPTKRAVTSLVSDMLVSAEGSAPGSARALALSAGRFVLPDTATIHYTPQTVEAGSSRDMRVLLAVAAGGGGWGFRASHFAPSTTNQGLQTVFEVVGWTFVTLLVFSVVWFGVKKVRRAVRRARGDGQLDGGLGDEEGDEEDEEEQVHVAMSQREIDIFPAFEFQKDSAELTPLKRTGAGAKAEKLTEEDLQCAVCMSEYEDGEMVRVLTCEHAFHCGCIDAWMAENGTCPMCRSDTQCMAVSLLSMADAGMESPLRFGKSVKVLRADEVPQVPLLVRLQQSGHAGAARIAHQDQPDEEADEEEAGASAPVALQAADAPSAMPSALMSSTAMAEQRSERNLLVPVQTNPMRLRQPPVPARPPPATAVSAAAVGATPPPVRRAAGRGRGRGRRRVQPLPPPRPAARRVQAAASAAAAAGGETYVNPIHQALSEE
jgi:hypothetical protein